ncbi:MAG: hypothetical protein HQM03_09530 [Magnetococcales bacterium]|nr:hypothetical protein [Magnetococcales bacterium]
MEYMRRLILLLCMLWAGGAIAAEPKILIINSNGAIARYEEIRKEFLAQLGQPAHTVDLQGKEDATASVAAEVARYAPDIIFNIGSQAHQVANEKFKEIRQVFAAVINWRRFPVGEYALGVSNEPMSGMQFSLMRSLFPNLKRIGVLFSPEVNREWVETAAEEAKSWQFDLVTRPITDPSRLRDQLINLLEESDALWLISDPVVLSSKEAVLAIFAGADKLRKPVVAYNELFAQYGAALVVSVDTPTIGRQAAMLAKKILNSPKPAGEKVVSPAGSYVILNRKQVSRYDLKINNDAIDMINRIIE